MERAAAHERKKALKKALTEDADADALRGPMLSAPLRVADDLSLEDQPSLPAFRPSGPVTAEHSASVHEREFEMSLFSLPVN